MKRNDVWFPHIQKIKIKQILLYVSHALCKPCDLIQLEKKRTEWQVYSRFRIFLLPRTTKRKKTQLFVQKIGVFIVIAIRHVHTFNINNNLCFVPLKEFDWPYDMWCMRLNASFSF